MESNTYFTNNFLIILLIALGFSLAIPEKQASAQTPVTQIENAAGDSVFTVFEDGALLLLGESTGVIPVEGGGTRLLWYPAEAAFRVGSVSSSQWDDDKIGENSVAMGDNTIASGLSTTAIGFQTTASGNYSTTMGAGATANGNTSTAMGKDTEASGSVSTAMGFSTIAATSSSLSIGLYNSANTSNDNTLFVAGNGTSSTPSDALVLKKDGHLIVGDTIESQNGGFILPDGTALSTASDLGVPTNGNGASLVDNDNGFIAKGNKDSGLIPTEGAGIRMMWYPAKVAFRAGEVNGTQWDKVNIGDNSIAFGENTTASGNNSTAMGVNTISSNIGATAMGYETNASGQNSTAMGQNTTASGLSSGAMGQYTTAATNHSLSIGKYNSANASDDNTLFVAGNGTSSTPSDALVLDKDAGLVVKGEEGTGVIPASGAGTRMMWYPAKGAFRVGEVGSNEWDDFNIGNNSVAMGERTTASGDNSTAMGDFNDASGNWSTAMGVNNTASGGASTAMGDGTLANGVWSTTMGDGTIARTDASLSIGKHNSANSSADNTLFVVGNGFNPSNRSDALVLDENGDMTISGTLTESSDRRLKTNISSISDNTLEKLSKITPSTFEFKNQQTHPSGQQIGLIAQQVQKEFPELTNKNSKGYLSVSYSKFTAVLLKGMQEQQQKIEKQQTTIEQLEEKTRRITALEKQMSEIKDSRQMAGMPTSAFGILLLGIAIGGGFWWHSNKEETHQA